MSIGLRPQDLVPRQAQGRWTRIVIPADFLLFHLGYFSMLPLLPLIVSSRLGPGSSLGVGAMLLLFNGAFGGACLPFTPLLTRLGAKTGMVIGLACSAVGVGLLAYANSAGMIAFTLILAGAGMSVHGVAARSVITAFAPSDAERNWIYSVIQIAVNVSAAIGPMAATTIYAVSGSRPVLFMGACGYLMALILVLLRVPRGIRSPASPGRWPISRHVLRAVFTDPDSRRVVLVSIMGRFLYAQFFSAIALLITLFVTKGPEQGLLFLEDAVAVIALQVPASALIQRSLRRGMRPSSAMRLGVLVFSISLLTLAILLWAEVPVFFSALVAILIFAAAETIYTPIADTAYSRLPTDSAIEAFSLRQVFVTLAEAGGSLCGAGVFLSIARHGTGAMYWGILAILGLLIAAGSGSRAIPGLKSTGIAAKRSEAE